MPLSQGSIAFGPMGLSLKAWVRFNGSTGAIDAQFNVASVVRTLAGTYTVTFTQAMAGARYIIARKREEMGRTTNSSGATSNLQSQNTASCVVETVHMAGGITNTAVDCPSVYVEFWE